MGSLLTTNLNRWPWQRRSFVALKIANSSPACYRAARMEIDIASRISSMWSTHQGEEYIRKALDSFEVNGPGGKHICIAFEPLRQPVWLFGRQLSTGVIPPIIIKALLPSILKGLDFLHSECHLIHTGDVCPSYCCVILLHTDRKLSKILKGTTL